jgi:hypothetical protein
MAVVRSNPFRRFHAHPRPADPDREVGCLEPDERAAPLVEGARVDQHARDVHAFNERRLLLWRERGPQAACDEERPAYGVQHARLAPRTRPV